MRVCPLRTETLGYHGEIVSEPEDLIRTITDEGVHDPRLLGTLRSVPRIGFVPADLAGQAYEDKPLPIPHDQVTTQPSLVARMVAALGLAGSERVLEVGAGYAWQTALLARLCGFEWAVERFEDVAGGRQGEPRPVRREERRGRRGRRDEGSTRARSLRRHLGRRGLPFRP